VYVYPQYPPTPPICTHGPPESLYVHNFYAACILFRVEFVEIGGKGGKGGIFLSVSPTLGRTTFASEVVRWLALVPHRNMGRGATWAGRDGPLAGSDRASVGGSRRRIGVASAARQRQPPTVPRRGRPSPMARAAAEALTHLLFAPHERRVIM
jgi:hypothetical protein